MKYIGSTTRDLKPQVHLEDLSADERQFREARYELVSRLNEAGHYGCIVYADSYKGKGTFSRHLYPINPATLTYEERGEVQLDALYDKTKLYPVDLPHITDYAVAAICNDKVRTSEIAGDLQPRQYTLGNPEDLAKLHELDNGSGLVVVKSPVGFGGKEVLIDTVEHLQSHLKDAQFPLISQEFIETSQGIPGLTSGRHDVRVLILNGEVLGGSVRTPREGGYLSNTHQGGSMRILTIEELPRQLLEMAAEVDDRLPARPRLYAADFMYNQSSDKWFLVELNGNPGALPSSFGPIGEKFQRKLLNFLIELAGR